MRLKLACVLATLVASLLSPPGTQAADPRQDAVSDRKPFFVPPSAQDYGFSLASSLAEYGFLVEERFPPDKFERDIVASFESRGWIYDDRSSRPYEFFPTKNNPARGGLTRSIVLRREGCFAEIVFSYRPPAGPTMMLPESRQLRVSVAIAKMNDAKSDKVARELCL